MIVSALTYLNDYQKKNCHQIINALPEEKRQSIVEKSLNLSRKNTMVLINKEDVTYFYPTDFFKKHMLIAGIDTKENFDVYEQLDSFQKYLLTELIRTCFQFYFLDMIHFIDYMENYSDDSDDSEYSFHEDVFDEKIRNIKMIFLEKFSLVNHQDNYNLLVYAAKIISQIKQSESTNYDKDSYFFEDIIRCLFHAKLLSINNLDLLTIDSDYMQRQIESFKKINPMCMNIELKNHLYDLNNGREELNLALNFRRSFIALDTVQLTEYLQSIEQNILTIIPDMDELILLVQTLTITQCKILFETTKNQLRHILPHSGSLTIFLHCLEKDRYDVVFSALKDHIIDVIVKSYDHQDISDYLEKINYFFFPKWPDFFKSISENNSTNVYQSIFDNINKTYQPNESERYANLDCFYDELKKTQYQLRQSFEKTVILNQFNEQYQWYEKNKNLFQKQPPDSERIKNKLHDIHALKAVLEEQFKTTIQEEIYFRKNDKIAQLTAKDINVLCALVLSKDTFFKCNYPTEEAVSLGIHIVDKLYFGEKCHFTHHKNAIKGCASSLLGIIYTCLAYASFGYFSYQTELTFLDELEKTTAVTEKLSKIQQRLSDYSRTSLSPILENYQQELIVKQQEMTPTPAMARSNFR